MTIPSQHAVSSAKKIRLPAPRRDGAISLEKTLCHRRSVREFGSERLELWQVAQLLWAAQGITDPAGYRTAPSAGALYPIELYVAAGNVSGLPPGIYSCDIQDYGLTTVIQGDRRWELSEAALSQTSLLQAPAIFVLSAIYERTTAKYGERGIRYVHIEIGHAAENLLLQAAALDLGAVVVGAFNDARVKRILALSDRGMPLCLIPVGKS